MGERLSIGIWPYALTLDIIAFLEPAAARYGGRIEDGPGWHTWTVHKGETLVGAAHVARTVEQTVDVVLLGGRGFREWLPELDDRIAEWAKIEGATRVRAIGREGWARVIFGKQIGPAWRAVAWDGDAMEYERRL